MRAEVTSKYSGKKIAVLDADASHEALVLRIYGDGEPRPLFVKKVVTVELRSCETGKDFDRMLRLYR